MNLFNWSYWTEKIFSNAANGNIGGASLLKGIVLRWDEPYEGAAGPRRSFFLFLRVRGELPGLKFTASAKIDFGSLYDVAYAMLALYRFAFEIGAILLADDIWLPYSNRKKRRRSALQGSVLRPVRRDLKPQLAKQLADSVQVAVRLIG